MTPKIAVILVLYNKSEVATEKYLLNFDSVLIVVDNTEGQDLDLKQDRVSYIPLRHNYGIARAQNIGIETAVELGCEYIVFFDQDSDIPNNYCTHIISAYQHIKTIRSNLFLLGPQVINKQTQREYKELIKKRQQIVNGFKEEREIISSGSCLHVSSLDLVGRLDEELFIDYVDFEWCWRAKKMGLISGIATQVSLPHEVGSKEVHYGLYHVIISAPIRYYYQTRNMLLLSKRSYVPFAWKISKIARLIINFILFLFDRNYHSNLKFMIKGVKDGLFAKKNNL